MTTSLYRVTASVLLTGLVFAPGSLAAADEPLGSLVKKFTEKQATPVAAPVATQPVVAPAAVPVAAPTPTPTAGGRKPSPPLASLARPKASGPLRVLLVDDDASSNNVGGDTGAAQGSDGIFRELVAKAVGGSADAWSVEVVRHRENGPAFERLRGFNVVLWYTGAAYGANNDTIGREDEKVLRRYLQEVGGAVILVSPGYVNNLVYGQSWDAAEHPFLKEVLAVNGCYGMVQRGARGTVRAYSGAEFPVNHPGVVETLFSAVNPDGAALVFTSPLDTAYAKREGGIPVAVASNYGQGRIVYAGFTLENVPEQERAKAFALLLDAATGPAAGETAGSNSPVPVSTGGRVITQLPPGGTLPKTLSQRPAGPPPRNLKIVARAPAFGDPTLTHFFEWEGNSEPQRHLLLRLEGDRWNVVNRNPPDGPYFSDGFGATSQYSLELRERWIYPGTQFKVRIEYQDGREGEAEITYTNPEMLQRVASDLRAVQTGYRKLRVTWKRPQPLNAIGRGAGGSLFAAGLPQGSASPPVTAGSPDVYIDITNVPEGRHNIHVAFHGMTRLLPNDARGVAEVLPVMGNRIRVVLLGFRVGRKTTDDDVFDGDGRGDEVYFTAYRANIPLRNRPAGVAPFGIVQSVVIGDTNNFPSRQRAGTAGPTGGVRSGDAVPSEAALAAQPGIAASRDRLPMLLWEGRLDREHNATVVALTGWEWDVSPAVPADAWSSRWDVQWTKDRLFDIASSAAIDTPDEIRYQPLSAPDARNKYGASATRGGTRPLGGLMAGPGTWECVPYGIALTLRNVESLLGNAAAAVVNAPLSMRRSPVAAWDNPAERDASEYTAILQIERLPLTAAEISVYTGPWVPDLRYATPPPSQPPPRK